MFETLKQRLMELLGLLPSEDAKIASQLLKSAESTEDINYVLTESGIGQIPTELLAPHTPKPPTFKVTAKQAERRSAPRTGSEAKRRRTDPPEQTGSIIVVRKTSGRRRAAS